MSYFYDDDICFTRLSFPHMLSKSTVPAGKGSIQAELYFSDDAARTLVQLKSKVPIVGSLSLHLREYRRGS